MANIKHHLPLYRNKELEIIKQLIDVDFSVATK